MSSRAFARLEACSHNGHVWRSGAPMSSSSCDFQLHVSRAIVGLILEMTYFLSSTQLCLFMPSDILSPSRLGTLAWIVSWLLLGSRKERQECESTLAQSLSRCLLLPPAQGSAPHFSLACISSLSIAWVKKFPGVFVPHLLQWFLALAVLQNHHLGSFVFFFFHLLGCYFKITLDPLS